MYCPKCGSLLDQGNREWRCPTGEMLLSVGMQRRLSELFDEDSPVEPVEPLSYRVGGQWFCPLDGSPMQASDGVVACLVCHRSLNPVLYRLTELHPHRNPATGKWR